ncbi:NAD(P)/FAD-dependent oxidoreductase [Pseudonocardia sp. KRD291]|uniref:NAD(P)/FAD-dependent oxidoreductase n=1 Tax=Pseudonocardia sp. KRD291 TaxID=2792007 RepID=UPI001C49CA08|nr:FAD-dependent oxidoreductase [Pseudonocardia sp. KRD291]MBW0101847.1 tryptophan 7-halogenase [Pseudonocardia sp. KRD291]
MDITIVGGGAAALMTALLAARDGHRVTVLERDTLPRQATGEDAAASAFRGSAPQVVQPHVLLSLFRLLMREHLPDVYRDLLAAGAVESDLAAQMPPALTERAVGPDDDRFTMLLTRRSTVDWVLGRAARAEPGVTLRTGATVRGLLTGPGARGPAGPRVVGVGTDVGDLRSDVVVDASGRRTRIDRWLAAIGARARPARSAECGVAYFSRHYRLRTRSGLPARPDNRTILALDEFTVGVWGADNDTMVVGICPLTEDTRFRRVRDPRVFTEVLRTVAPFRGWLDVMDPISDVFPMAGLHNTMHRLVADGAPLAPGLHAVGDSVCTTNPTLARGLGVGLRGALDLVEVLAEHPSDPVARALAADRAVTEHVEPYYLDQARIDAERLRRVRANLAGRPPRSPAAPAGPAPSVDRVGFGELAATAPHDASLFRSLTTVKGMLARPDDVYTDPAVVRRVRAVLDTHGGTPGIAQPDPTALHRALR